MLVVSVSLLFTVGFLSICIMLRYTLKLQERVVKYKIAPILACPYSPFLMDHLARLMFHQIHLGKRCIFSPSTVSRIFHMVNYSLPLCPLGE